MEPLLVFPVTKTAMTRFAHIADVHLGAFRDARLRELNLQAFEKAMAECGRRQVDFVIIAGDLFDINIPDLAVVERAVRAMRQLKTPIYAVYGSHDYSPTQTSVIDVLNEAGVLQKVSSGRYVETHENKGATESRGEKKENDASATGLSKLQLDVLTDPKTGVKITGISARKLGLEKTYFQDLDAAALEAISGPKIFVFHCAIQEHKPQSLQRVDAVPLSLFPKGFDYYAGGHVHARLLTDYGSGKIAYPGPLSAADFRDMEEAASAPHGFYVVDLDAKNVEFVPVGFGHVQLVRVDADGKTAQAANEKILQACQDVQTSDIGLLHAKGTLCEGKASDIDWTAARKALELKCPIVYLNNALESKERQSVRVDAQHPEAIAENVFKEVFADRTLAQGFGKDAGVKLALDLLRVLREENPGDNKKRWEDVVAAKAEKVLGIES